MSELNENVIEEPVGNLFYYLNDDYSVRPCTLEEWMVQFIKMKEEKTHVMASDTVNSRLISTVFLGQNHSYFGGEPILFETIIFSNGLLQLDNHWDRYSSWEEAMKGHKEAIDWVLNGCKDDEKR